MGQVSTPRDPPSLILSAVDRLIASNADGGLSPLASHIVLLGENAGRNLADVDYIYVIGADSLAGGLVSVSSTGSVVVGAKNLSALTNAALATLDGPFVVVGYNINPTAVNRMGEAILIGTNMLTSQPGVNSAPVQASVVIGNSAIERHSMTAGDGGNILRSVLIGWRVARGQIFSVADSGCSIQRTIAIGAEALVNCGDDGPGRSIVGSVIIGSSIAPSLSSGGVSANSDVLIGESAVQAYRGGNGNIAVGSGVALGATGQIYNVVIGANANCGFANDRGFNTVIGSFANALGLNNYNVLIGSGADGTVGPATAKQLLVAILDQGTGIQESLLYGVFGDGNLCVGKSIAANRAFPGTNLLKLTNGTSTGVAPVGGGYFYSIGGELHWVSTGGVDYALTPSASLGNFTVALLPVAPPAGARGFATDALAPAFGAAVVGGGAVFIPVFFDGAAWIVG